MAGCTSRRVFLGVGSWGRVGLGTCLETLLFVAVLKDRLLDYILEVAAQSAGAARKDTGDEAPVARTLEPTASASSAQQPGNAVIVPPAPAPPRPHTFMWQWRDNSQVSVPEHG